MICDLKSKTWELNEKIYILIDEHYIIYQSDIAYLSAGVCERDTKQFDV